ncbi:ankyrin repeat and SOCS box protein 1 isoform X3 [Pristis pectinata]|uniref:ankyrin repeat and SOCS box protein 1 isoform X3 n=1 Tax=Pristis pectinata TaxID=685728 RepID=UPI00223CB2E8|nr:ankyrin repeat and SOCS box protein 1 isoform X3 [Pristis pectinata]
MSERQAAEGGGGGPLSPGAEYREEAEGEAAAAAAGARAGRDLKEWLREQFCDGAAEGAEDTRLHDATYVGDLATIATLLKEDNFRRYGADVDVDHHLASRVSAPAARRFTSLGVCPLYISSAYHHLQCFKLLLKAGANPDYNYWGHVDVKAFPRGSPTCILDAVLRHGCDVQFVKLLIDFGANLNLVNWEGLDVETMGRMKVKEEALQVFRAAKGTPRTLTSSCRIVIRRALGKFRLNLIQTLPIPDTIKIFLLHEDT